MTVFLPSLEKDSLDGLDNTLYRENIERNMQVFMEHKSAIINGNPVHFTVQMQQKLEAQAEQLRSALKTAEEANRAKSDCQGSICWVLLTICWGCLKLEAERWFSGKIQCPCRRSWKMPDLDGFETTRRNERPYGKALGQINLQARS